MFSRESGVTLVELLLVLVVMAIIITFSVSRYRYYHNEAELGQVRSDIAMLARNLNAFYDQQRCDSDGYINNPSLVGHNIIHQVAEQFSDTPLQRRPLVQSYAVYIIDTGLRTHNHQSDDPGAPDPEKEIYTLKVQANLNAGLSDSRTLWLSQTLNAQSEEDHRVLTWSALPGSGQNDYGTNPFWVMQGSRELLKRQQITEDLISHGQTCAH